MAPTTLRRLTDYEVDYTISLVSKQKVAKEVLAKEIQATEPLDVVYLLKLWRPHLTWEATSLFIQQSLSAAIVANSSESHSELLYLTIERFFLQVH